MARKWTPEEREAQRALIREQKPWQHSTGPRTAAGKKASALNATTHGLHSAEMHEWQQSLRNVRANLQRLQLELMIDENELE